MTSEQKCTRKDGKCCLAGPLSQLNFYRIEKALLRASPEATSQTLTRLNELNQLIPPATRLVTASRNNICDDCPLHDLV